MGGDTHRPAAALGRGPARAPHRGRQHPPAPLPAVRLRRRARAPARGRRGDHGGRGRVLGVAVHRLSRSRPGRRQPAGAVRLRRLSLQDVLRRDQQARLHAVSRRGAPRGVLRDGAHHRRDRACGGARAGGRAGREPRAGERDALHQRHRKVLRQRRLPGQRCRSAAHDRPGRGARPPVHAGTGRQARRNRLLELHRADRTRHQGIRGVGAAVGARLRAGDGEARAERRGGGTFGQPLVRPGARDDARSDRERAARHRRRSHQGDDGAIPARLPTPPAPTHRGAW